MSRILRHAPRALREAVLAGNVGGLDPFRRWYFRASTVAEVSPAFDSAWTNTTSATRLAMVTVKDASDAVFSTGSVSWTAGQLRLIRQYVGPMMRGGVVLDAAVVRSVLRASEGAADDNASARFGLRVCSADGNTIRATLLAVGQHGVGTEFPTSAESRIFANSAEASAYTTLPGDRFVAEFGASDAAGTTPMAALQFGSGASGGGDMDFDEGAFFSNPWLEIAPAA